MIMQYIFAQATHSFESVNEGIMVYPADTKKETVSMMTDTVENRFFQQVYRFASVVSVL